MRIFLSWSGDISREFAHVFQEMLSQVLPWAQIYLSDEEIESGERWLSNITTALDGTSYGVLFVTAQNKAAPWLIFEAGALSKNMAESRVVPLLCDIEDVDLTGNPLSQFQYRKLTKVDVERLIKDINTKCDMPVPWERLSRTFEKFWPDFEPSLNELQQNSANSKKQESSGAKSKLAGGLDVEQLQNSLNEILRTLRTNNRSLPDRDVSPSLGLISGLASSVDDFSPSVTAMIDFGHEDYIGEVDVYNGLGRLLYKSNRRVAMRYEMRGNSDLDYWQNRFVRSAKRMKDRQS